MIFVTDSDKLVELKNITKIYGSFKALDKVSFDLKKGEVHCLVGENGAGKSTLIKVLSGAVSPEGGEIHYLKDEPIKSLTPREAIKLGISTIYQDAELVDSLTVVDNIFLGEEESSRAPFVVNVNSQTKKAKEIINMLNLNLPYDVLVEELSTSQKQMLQIVKALYKEAKILIMDEPTSSLGLDEKKALMKIVRDLRERGIGIIYISHYLEEIFDIGDRVTVLRDGKNRGTYNISEVDTNMIIRKMVGRDASMFFSRKPVEIGETRVKLKNFNKFGVVENVSFDVRKGEIFGIGGLVGSGRSELMTFVFGAEEPDSGKVIIDNKELKINSPKDAIKQGICFITEDRKKLGMLRGRNVIENIAVIHNENFKGPLLDLKEERSLSNKIVGELSIMVSSDEQKVEELSGGNQQKVIIGKWLIDEADLYIFDEPTKGVDVGAKEQIYNLLVELAEKGKCIIMISSDMPELLSMSDRIGVMRNGRMVEIFENEGITEEELIKKFIGV
jgi:ribose transport system ATP-binding protein